ncbi:MAG: hypothetical protein R3E66_12015 [bacterium]
MSEKKKGLDENSEFDASEWTDLGGEDASRVLKGLEAMIPGILRRSIISGLTSALSEEGIRSVVTEKNIPKEAVGFVLSQADSTRREILRIVSREIRTFLENMDFGGEIAKILTTLSFEIRTEVRFIPNNEAVKPNIRNRVKIKRLREDGHEETVNEFEETSGPEIPETKARPRRDAPSKSDGRKRWSRKTSVEEE